MFFAITLPTLKICYHIADQLLITLKVMAHPTGFFDLPLELRQMVYEELYDDKAFNIRSPVQCRGAIRNLCATDPRIKDEILDWQDFRYREAHFSASIYTWRPPLERFLPKRLQEICIDIEHYFYYDRADDAASLQQLVSRSPQETLNRLQWTHENVVKLVKVLNGSLDGPLPRIYVIFPHYLGGRKISIDPFWCTDPGIDLVGGPLRTIDGTDRSKTMFQYLLEPLIELKKCREFRYDVPTCIHLQNRRGDTEPGVSRRTLRRDIFHAETFYEAMKEWLEGRVDREQIPFHWHWKKLLVQTRYGKRCGKALKDEELRSFGVRGLE